MMQALRSMHIPARILLAAMVLIAICSTVIRTRGIVDSTTFLYVVQPAVAVALAALTFAVARDVHDRIRHKGDKIIIIASILAIWFVLYMVSGLAVTYLNNALGTSPAAILKNALAFGLPMFAIEYTRYKIMSSTSRRHLLPVGALVTVVFALQQMSFAYVGASVDVEQAIQLVIGTFIPIIVSSMLLTYLAVIGGLGAQIMYQLGILAIMILPPFIPKYDWYLVGVTSMLVSIAVYVAIDRSVRPGRDVRPSHRHRTDRAYDIMLITVMTAMILFVTGVFAYKPSVILSNSMHPVFSRGSAVIIQAVNDSTPIREGDIIQFERDNILVTHRVVTIESSKNTDPVYITKGDNSPSKDPPVNSAQVVGVVRAQVPYIGYPTVWLREIGR